MGGRPKEMLMSTQSDSTISRSGTPASEEQLVRAVLDRVYAAWAANDADAFVEPYAEEATAQLPGASLPNRAAIHSTMTAVFAGELKGTRAVHEPRSVRFLGDDVAVVISQSAIVFPGQSEPAEQTRAFDTWVLSKRIDAWRVEAFHQCPQSND
jgi:uncharacterized protein (TIGR02246 family)